MCGQKENAVMKVTRNPMRGFGVVVCLGKKGAESHEQEER